MRMKPLRKLILITALAGAVVGMHAPPASAAVAGGGTVTGNVHVTPGIDLTVRPTSYTFTPIPFAGTITAVSGSNAATFEGVITTSPVTGSSPGENTVSGSGSVNPFTFSGSNPACTISGSGSGSFSRVGGIVIVTLTVTATINCPPLPPVTATATVIVDASFVPTSGDGTSPTVPTGTPVTDAAFAGTFVAAAAP